LLGAVVETTMLDKDERGRLLAGRPESGWFARWACLGRLTYWIEWSSVAGETS
jgi:hypothetical protein